VIMIPSNAPFRKSISHMLFHHPGICIDHIRINQKPPLSAAFLG
jgi:hypothetical protein